MNNKGIIITGGQFSASQVAVGNQARINNDGSRGESELLGKLDELLSAIQVADIQLDERKDVEKNINLLKEQAKAIQPNKTIMDKSLAMIEKTLPAITGIVSLIAAIKTIAGL
jgi:hypothetical protein